MKYDKKVLSILDNALSPDGKKIDDNLFDSLLSEFADDLIVFTEPDPKKEDEYVMWEESSTKHKIFDYWSSSRPKNLPKFPGNDLPWILACYAFMEPEVETIVSKKIKTK